MCKSDEFAHFNVFNGHFFHGDASFRSWCSKSKDAKVAVVVDPPFGGRLDALSKTLGDIGRLVSCNDSDVDGKLFVRLEQ